MFLEEWILEQVGEREALAQLAEECAELAHAALKLRRALGDENPTPELAEACRTALIEEAADVQTVLDILPAIDRREMQFIQRHKLARWGMRLKERNNEHE